MRTTPWTAQRIGIVAATVLAGVIMTFALAIAFSAAEDAGITTGVGLSDNWKSANPIALLAFALVLLQISFSALLGLALLILNRRS